MPLWADIGFSSSDAADDDNPSSSMDESGSSSSGEYCLGTTSCEAKGVSFAATALLAAKALTVPFRQVQNMFSRAVFNGNLTIFRVAHVNCGTWQARFQRRLGKSTTVISKIEKLM